VISKKLGLSPNTVFTLRANAFGPTEEEEEESRVVFTVAVKPNQSDNRCESKYGDLFPTVTKGSRIREYEKR
jgi:hypothetical protein